MTATIGIDEFLESNMRQGRNYTPARLQAALALLERVRSHPSLNLSDHKRPNSSGLIAHERWGELAHRRLALELLNKNHGRRSNDIGGWGPGLLEQLRAMGFETASPAQRDELIDAVQARIAAIIRGILEADPIEVRIKGRSAESVIREILKQAEDKGKSGDVAQYLVGAKLMLRLGLEIEVVQSNKGDRRSRDDVEARTGDYEIEDATIEVAVGIPDDKHLSQVADALEDSETQVWLLTRFDRVETWSRELTDKLGVDMKRVVVSGVEAFVGQNMSEMGSFSAKETAAHLQKLFDLYNDRWVAKVGTPGIRIVVK